MNKFCMVLTIALTLLGFVPNSGGAPWDLSGHLTAQTRHHSQAARWRGQQAQPGRMSLGAVAELRWRSSNGKQRASSIASVRWDQTDKERSVTDLREAYWATQFGPAEFLLGINTVFWGVAESVHLVNVINQTDFVADIDGETKLGQPMANLALQTDWGLVSLYVMPYFRERTFAGAKGRLRPARPVETHRPKYESEDEQHHLDLALRYSHYFDDVDIGVSLFRGTSREPRLLPNAEGTALVPHYDQITQAGLDLQLTREAWLWKLEAIVREGHSKTFSAAVGGFEYTFYQVWNSAADIGLLVEYQYDGRSNREPLTLSDNDLFVGTRLSLNNTQNTSVLAGISHDLETSGTFLNIEAQRRIGSNLALEFKARLFGAGSSSGPLQTVARDDYLELLFSWYF